MPFPAFTVTPLDVVVITAAGIRDELQARVLLEHRPQAAGDDVLEPPDDDGDLVLGHACELS